MLDLDEQVARHGGGPVTAPIVKTTDLKKRTGIAMAVITVGIAAVQYFYGHFYGNRAEVSVECSTGPAGLQCTAEHTSGGKKAKACWMVEIHCQDGTKTVAPACAEVEKGRASTVTIAEHGFNGLETCDEPVGVDVFNLTLE
jgi:hypothetical protein